MIFDTAAGELPPTVFDEVIAPDLATLTRAFPRKLGYYAKGIKREHLSGRLKPGPASTSFLDDLSGIGVDREWDMASTLCDRPHEGFVQGNFDQEALRLTGDALDEAIDRFLSPLQALDAKARRGWICGLGHGVLPGTPEESVRRFVTRVRAAFGN
jgi:uroporphyrinogen decarboxylase